MDGNSVKEHAAEVDVDKTRKQFFIMIVAAGVLIVILVILIIVLAINKGNDAGKLTSQPEASAEDSSDETDREGYILTDAELDTAYLEITDEATQVMRAGADSGEGFDGAIVFYLEKINSAEDVRLKAMLESDYYLLRFTQSPTEENKNEFLNNLMRIDEILQTPASAYNVVNLARYYNEAEILGYYSNLAKERELNVGDDEESDEELETAP